MHSAAGQHTIMQCTCSNPNISKSETSASPKWVVELIFGSARIAALCTGWFVVYTLHVFTGNRNNFSGFKLDLTIYYYYLLEAEREVMPRCNAGVL